MCPCLGHLQGRFWRLLRWCSLPLLLPPLPNAKALLLLPPPPTRMWELLLLRPKAIQLVLPPGLLLWHCRQRDWRQRKHR